MKLLHPLVSAVVVLDGVAAYPHVYARERNHQPDSQTLAHYAATGQCFYYFTNRSPGLWKVLEPCNKYCDKIKGGKSTYAECDVAAYKDINVEKASLPKFLDDDGNPWIPARCKCENKTVEVFSKAVFEVVAQGLSKLDNVLCAVFITAFKEIAEIGVNFIPGGAALKGIRTAVKGADKAVQFAKSAYENGMGPQEFYTDWVGKTCGVPGWNFSLEDQFMQLVTAPDSSMGDNKPTGCRLKDKSKCRDLPKPKEPAKEEPKKGEPKPKDSAPRMGGNKVI